VSPSISLNRFQQALHCWRGPAMSSATGQKLEVLVESGLLREAAWEATLKSAKPAESGPGTKAVINYSTKSCNAATAAMPKAGPENFAPPSSARDVPGTAKAMPTAARRLCNNRQCKQGSRPWPMDKSNASSTA